MTAERPCSRIQKFWTGQPRPGDGYFQKAGRERTPESLLQHEQLRFACLGTLTQVTSRMTLQRVVESRVFYTFPLRSPLHSLLRRYWTPTCPWSFLKSKTRETGSWVSPSGVRRSRLARLCPLPGLSRHT